MRLDSGGKALNEVNLYLTPDEARDLIRVLHDLIERQPTLNYLTHNHVEDAKDAQRELIVYVYTDTDVERQHDEGFAPSGNWRTSD